ncbi:PKD domain-containing protein, partial [bacterium]|nr:PKD domain-containing protein [bacterium]
MRNRIVRPTLAALLVLLAGCNFESATGPDAGHGPADNALPVANAGEDRSVIDTDQSGNEAVALDGSASMDPDGTIATHIWSLEGRFLAAGPSPTITLPPGVHMVTLAVTDNRGGAATDDVLVTVVPGTGNANIPPTADAGNDMTVSDN